MNVIQKKLCDMELRALHREKGHPLCLLLYIKKRSIRRERILSDTNDIFCIFLTGVTLRASTWRWSRSVATNVESLFRRRAAWRSTWRRPTVLCPHSCATSAGQPLRMSRPSKTTFSADIKTTAKTIWNATTEMSPSDYAELESRESDLFHEERTDRQREWGRDGV